MDSDEIFPPLRQSFQPGILAKSQKRANTKMMRKISPHIRISAAIVTIIVIGLAAFLLWPKEEEIVTERYFSIEK